MHFPIHRLGFLLFFLCTSAGLTAANYFWVGGTGNWSDISHWATTSGGGTTHAQAPTADDDVFFDANSFGGAGQTVTLNTGIIFCRTMDWTGATGNPNLVGAANVRLNVYGSLQLIGAMTYDFTGELIFAGNQTGNTIDIAGFTAAESVTFSGSGDWQLNSALSLNHTLELIEGSLNTNGQDINCQYFYSPDTGTRVLQLGASVITLTGSLIEPFFGAAIIDGKQALRLNAVNLTIDPGTSEIIFTHPEALFAFSGPGTIDLNRVFFSSPTGLSYILPFDPNFDFNNFPSLNYGELEVAHDLIHNGGANITNLILYAGKRYNFEGGYTFAFDAIQAAGDCLEGISLGTTDAGNPTNFSSPNAIVLDFVTLQGINAVGTGSFTANNAIDQGNNSGWTINARTSQDLYWVGGTGNWSNPMNWSFSSGGPGSGCLPSAVDDIFFDANSFSGAGQIVSVDVQNAFCRSMDWTGATGTPTLEGPDFRNVRVSGSLTFIANMAHDFLGSYFFQSAQAGNTITSAGQHFRFHAWFIGPAGEWTLQDEMNVDWTLNFQSGTIITNDQRVNTNWFDSDNTDLRELQLGQSVVYMTHNANNRPGLWRFNTTNLLLDADEATIISDGIQSNLFATEGDNAAQYHRLIFSASEVRLFSGTNSVSSVDSIFWLQNGFIGAFEQNIDYLLLSAGKTYDFRVGDTQNIGQLEANGDCDNGLVYIRAANPSLLTTFNFATDQTVTNVFLQDVAATGAGIATANNSFDGGNNPGWNITATTGRELFWVGDTGNWDDRAHWSLSSGGPGGECIPTPLDDVVFDANSFSTANPFVLNIGLNDAYCANMNWGAGVSGTPTLDLTFLNVFGSLDIRAPMVWSAQRTRFHSMNNETIFSNGVTFFGLEFLGEGTYDLQDPLNCNNLELARGTLRSNDQLITTNTFFAPGDAASLLDLGAGRMVCTYTDGSPFVGGFNTISPNFQVAAGPHTIELSGDNTSVVLRNPLEINNLLCSSPTSDVRIFMDGIGDILTANRIDFFGDGEIDGEIITDSLFCAPGKTYIFAAGRTQVVNEYWEIIGNNCTPIELSSSILGNQAVVSMPASGEVLANFIQMRDINAIGGANFLAGAFSTNIANSNTGWTFETRPDLVDVGFLGPDRALCFGDPVTLDAFNFSVGETYLWSDNSTNPTLTVNASGTYFAEVTFLDNCVIVDSIEVISAADFTVDIQDDPELCDGDQLVLTTGVSIGSATYTWQDGSTDPTFTVTASGEYFVEVDAGGCIDADTTTVTINTYPAIDLGMDLSRCAGETFTLSTATPADSYTWQDGSMMTSFMGNQAGIYFLDAANGSCVSRDSVTVVYVDAGAIDLGNDSTLCGVNSLTLTAVVPGATFNWQDGSMADSFTATQTGQYFVVADVSGCTTSDTINLTFFDTPPIDIDPQVLGCVGEAVTITLPAGADSYLWSDGDMDETFSTTSAGMYSVEVTFSSCMVTEDFEVVLNNFPVVQSLGADSTLCEGNDWILTAVSDLGTISWQDGSTAPTFTVNTAGDYFFTANNLGCMTTSGSTNVQILDLPDLDVAGDYTACTGTEFSLNTAVTADSYSWSNGDLGTTFTEAIPGSYTLTISIDHCSVTDDFAWTSVDPPVVDLGMDQSICANESLVLDAGQIGVWQDGSSSTTFPINDTGLYFVEVSVGDCSTRDSININVLTLPEFDLGIDQNICAGDSVQLSAPAGLGAISWEDGSMDLLRTLRTTGDYILNIEDANGCVGSDTVSLTFAELPFLDLGPDTAVCDNVPFILSPIIGEGQLEWFDGTNGPIFTVLRPLTVSAVLDNNGCIVTDEVQISFRECTFFQAYLPSGFSPNLDGVNDDFRPYFDDGLEVLTYQLQVYNRWGDRIFVSEDPNVGWRGDFKGEVADLGVYIYVIDISYRDDAGVGSDRISGDVTLVR